MPPPVASSPRRCRSNGLPCCSRQRGPRGATSAVGIRGPPALLPGAAFAVALCSASPGFGSRSSAPIDAGLGVGEFVVQFGRLFGWPRPIGLIRAAFCSTAQGWFWRDSLLEIGDRPFKLPLEVGVSRFPA